MDEKQRMTRFAADAAQAALMALALFMNMNVLSGNNYVNFAAVFQPFSMSVTAVACMAFFALRMARGRLPESGKRAKLVCLLLGAWR